MGTKLRAVASEDPELFNRDLDWFYNVFDSECGHQSPTGHVLEAQESKTVSAYMARQHQPACDACGALTRPDGAGSYCPACTHWQCSQTMPVHVETSERESDPYNDSQVRLRGEEAERGQGSITKGRRIWNRLVRLPWATQEDIRLLYEPRRDRPGIGEERTRAAHKAYLNV